MPIYEYECTRCGHRFEKIQSFKSAPIKKCPQCGSKVEKLLHAPAVQFKGAGWYATDYAKSPGGTRAADEGAATSDDAKAEKPVKTEAPAESTEKKPAKKKK